MKRSSSSITAIAPIAAAQDLQDVEISGSQEVNSSETGRDEIYDQALLQFQDFIDMNKNEVTIDLDALISEFMRIYSDDRILAQKIMNEPETQRRWNFDLCAPTKMSDDKNQDISIGDGLRFCIDDCSDSLYGHI